MPTDNEMTSPAQDTSDNPKPLKRSMRRGPALLGAAMVLTGAIIGAGAVGLTRPSFQMAPTTPVDIASLQSDSVVTIKGKVAEIYGNKFILADQTGRALIETGRAGEGQNLVTANESVSVQGRFENGFIHASYLIGPDGKVEALGPLPPPPHNWLQRVIGPR